MTTNGTERRAAATEWLAAAAAGREMTGTELGERFGRSPGWGRGVIRDARAADAPVPAPAAATERHDSGNQQVTDGAEAGKVASEQPIASELKDESLPRHAARRPWHETAVVLLVAVVAAAASYGHMRSVALLAGEPEWIAYLFPLTVDGLVLAALRRGEEGRWWLALALAVSVASNVAAAEATVLGRLVAAWPPLALYGTHRLLAHRLSGDPSTCAP